MDQKVRYEIELDGADASASEIEKLMGSFRSLGATVKTVGGESTGALAGLNGSLGLLSGGIFAAVGAAAVLGATVRTMFEGIQQAQILKDLQASVNAVSSSEEVGKRAFATLQAAADKTRITGDQLVSVYGKLLPAALDRGFSEAGAQKFVTQIAKAAPALGQSIEKTVSEALSIVSGRVEKTNLLAHAIGLDPHLFNKGLQGLEETFPKLDELARKGEAMGQTFDSAGAKIKDSFVTAFAEGITQAEGNTQQGITSITSMLNSPELLESIRGIGLEFGKWVPEIIAATKKALEVIAGFIAGIRNIREGANQRPGGIGPTRGSLAGALSPDSLIFSDFEQGLSDRAGKQAAELRRIVEFQRTFGQYSQTTQGPLPADVYGPAIPLITEYVTGVSKAADTQKKWSSELAGTGEQLNRNGNQTEKYVGALDSANAMVERARVGFAKLFTPPESDPLLRQIQQVDEAAAAMTANLTAERNRLLTQAARADMPAATAAGMKTAATALDQFIQKISQALPELENFYKKDFLRKALEEDDKKIQQVDESFSQFIENSTRAINGVTQGGVGDALAGELKKIQGAMDAAIAQSRTEDIMGIAAFTPAKLKEIVDRYTNMGRDLTAETKLIVTQIGQEFDTLSKQIFSSAKPGLSGMTDFTGVFKQLQQLQDSLAHQLQDRNARNGLTVSWEEAITQVQPKLDASFKHAAEVSVQQYETALSNFSQSIGDILSASLLEGGKGFAQSSAALFSQTVSKTLSGLIRSLGGSVFPGGENLQRLPGETDAAFASRQSEANTKAGAALNGVVSLTALLTQLASASSSNVNNPRQNPIGTVVGTTLTGLSAGAAIGSYVSAGSLGGIIGAIVGLIIGGLMLALAPAVGKDYPYAKFGFDTKGRAQFDPTQNISKNELRDALQRMQTARDTLWNGYVDILAELPVGPLNNVLDKIARDLQPIIGKDIGGDVGHAASKDFWTDFNNWVAQGLPKEMAERFFAPLESGFVALGVSATRFQQVWEMLQNADPKELIQSLKDWAIGLREINDAVKEFRTPAVFPKEVAGETLLDQARRRRYQSFSSQLQEGDRDIVKFGEHVQNMVGPAQLTGIRQFGDMLADRMNRVREIMGQIASTIDSVRASYQASIRGLVLEGMTKGGKPDVDAQVQYLKNYADTLFAQIRTATTPEQITSLSNELQNTILQIRQLGGSVSADAAEAYRKWAITNLQNAQDLVTARLTELAQEIQAQNQAFLDAIQGFIDAFNAATDQLPTPTNTPDQTHIVTPGEIPSGGGSPHSHLGDGDTGGNPYQRGHRGPMGDSNPTDPWNWGDWGYGEPGTGLWRPGRPRLPGSRTPYIPPSGIGASARYDPALDEKSGTYREVTRTIQTGNTGNLNMLQQVHRQLVMLNEKMDQANTRPVPVRVTGGLDITIDDQSIGEVPLDQDISDTTTRTQGGRFNAP